MHTLTVLYKMYNHVTIAAKVVTLYNNQKQQCTQHTVNILTVNTYARTHHIINVTLSAMHTLTAVRFESYRPRESEKLHHSNDYMTRVKFSSCCVVICKLDKYALNMIIVF